MTILGQLDGIMRAIKQLPVYLKLIFMPLIAIITVTYAIISFTMNGLNRLLTLVDDQFADLDLTVAGHSLDSVASDFWTTVNTFVPIDTVFSLAAVLLALRGIMVLARVIKSWIPTIG